MPSLHDPASTVSVPGRVNLIGEHIDYHDLPVMPMAIARRVVVDFRPSSGRRIRASSGEYGDREFDWTERLEPGAPGDWVNYVKAAAQAVGGKWKLERGVEASVTSDLPAAAGLSSSSALLVAFTLALLRANGVSATFEELMEILPEGEYFVGTRGGGMDHAAVLASRAGHALLVHFNPVAVRHIRIPPDWSFLVAHSMTTAEKSGHMREEFNLRRSAGRAALDRLGFESFRQALAAHPHEELIARAKRELVDQELRSFLHVVSEDQRVAAAVRALESSRAEEFGRLISASHVSLRDDLRISNEALDELVEQALRAGALGARLTGGGFGGCAIVFCRASERTRVAQQLTERFYAGRPGFDRAKHLIDAEPSQGALA